MVAERWHNTELKELVQKGRKISYGIVQPGSFTENGIILIRGKDYSRGWVAIEDFFRVSPEIDRPYRRSKVNDGDILLTIVGEYTGNTAVVPNWLENANITQTTARIAIDPAKANSTYIFYALTGRPGKREVYRYKKGGAQPGLNIGDVEKFRLPQPPLSEQRKIAEILSTWDKAIETTEKLLANAEAQKKALMQQLLTGKRQLKGFEGEWREVRLGDVCSPKQWPTISQRELVSSGYPVYGANGFIGYYTEYNHAKPTIVVTCRGATCGTVNRTPENSYVTGNAMALDDVDNSQVVEDFLFHFLSCRGFTDIISGSAQPQIIGKDIKRVSITLPPMHKQNEIAKALNSSNEIIEISKKQIQLLIEEKNALMQQLLTGKRRVTV